MGSNHWRPTVAAFITGCMIASLAQAQPALEADEAFNPYVFTPTGVAQGEAQAILPAGAVLHVQINRLDRLVQDLSDLAMTFLPDKTLPPQYQVLLSEPQPLVRLLTAESMGMPMGTHEVAAILGIDFARPVTLTFYPMSPDEGFVLGVPFKDAQTFSMFVMGVLQPHHIEVVELDGGQAHLVLSDNPNFPAEMLVLCSQDTAYFCASEDIASALLGAPANRRLGASLFLTRTIARRADDDLVVAFDAMLLKGLASRLKQHHTIPDDADPLEMLRRDIDTSLSPQQRINIDMMLSQYAGIADLDQALDIVEVIVRVGYEELGGLLVAELMAFDGLVMTVDLTGTQQTIRLAAYSQSIDPSKAGAPLPIAAIKAAASRLPGAANYFTALGQLPAPAKPMWVDRLLGQIETRLVDENLPAAFFTAVRAYYAAVQPEAPLESKVPWIIRTQATGAAPQPTDEYETLADYVDSLGMALAQGQGMESLAMMPKQPDGFLDKHYASLAATANTNQQATQQFLRDLGQSHSWYDMTSRTLSDALDGGVKRVIMENSYVTRSGWFGFNEHELINRRFTLYHEAGEHLLVHEGGRDGSRLTAWAAAAPAPLPKSLAAAFDALPDDVRRIESMRVLHLLNDAVDWLAQIETLTHRDLEAYLAKAQQIIDGPGDDELKYRALLDLKIPLLLKTLKIDDQGKVYAVLPGELPFPRPKVAGVLIDLMTDFRAGSADLGGTLAIQRVAPGEWEGTLIQNTESLGLLVKTVANNFYEKYASSPQGQQTFEALFRTPRDQSHMFDDVILENTFWSFMQGAGG